MKAGLEQIMSEFKEKTKFMSVIKQSKKCTKLEGDLQEMYSVFVEATENYGNIPLPLLLKIKKGILFVPSMYTITEGLANAMK